MSSTLLAPSVVHWLPAPYKTLPGGQAVCPGCQAPGALVYSLSHRYIACMLCGWQRSLAAGQEAVGAALAAAGVGTWQPVLDALKKRAPDGLPPVAALRWAQTGPDTWEGPSRTTAGRRYIITRTGHYIHCSCECKRGVCWHLQRARELGCTDTDAMRDLWPA